MKYIIILFCLLAVSTVMVKSQDEVYVIGEAVEEIMALSDDDDPALLLEQLADLKDHPVRINSGDEYEIGRLFFLTDLQVRLLADHVRRNGNVVSLYELALLPAFDRSTAMLMAPYITLQPEEMSSRRGRDRTMITLTASTRFNADKDEVIGVRSLFKVKHDAGMLSLGMTAENDPGEPFTLKNAAGPDFLSGYVMYHSKGKISHIIIGDYSLRFGEGLLFNSSSWQGSWLTAPSFMTGRNSVVQYSASDENGFFRGISLGLGNMNDGVVFFASSNMIDARPVFDDDSVLTAVSNLVKGGIHISDYQRAARNRLTETITGIHLTAGADRIRGGMTSSVTWFSLPFRPDSSKAENIHSFTGNRLLNLAADIKAGTGPMLFFAEAAVSFPGSWAAVAGIRAKPSAQVTYNVLARHLSPDYYTFHSGTFRSGTGSGNETGIAASLHLEAARHFFITAAADNYRIPWPRYRSSSPSRGCRAEIRGEYVPYDYFSLRIVYNVSSREYDKASETGTAVPERFIRRSMTFILDYKPVGNIHLSTRASASFISPSEERGYLLCQDLSYSLNTTALKIWLRYALCTTDGYDSRLYAWENDMLSSFSVPAMYGESSRSFVMVSWKPRHAVEIRAKYVVMSSKVDLLKVFNHEVKMQCRILF